MHKPIAAGLMSLALGLTGAAGFASAQDMAPAVKAGPPSIDWPIADLLADTATHEVLAKDMPKLLTSDALDMIKQMSIRALAKFPQAAIDDAKLATVQADLAALTAPAEPTK
jgi:hypothetical protein